MLETRQSHPESWWKPMKIASSIRKIHLVPSAHTQVFCKIHQTTKCAACFYLEDDQIWTFCRGVEWSLKAAPTWFDHELVVEFREDFALHRLLQAGSHLFEALLLSCHNVWNKAHQLYHKDCSLNTYIVFWSNFRTIWRRHHSTVSECKTTYFHIDNNARYVTRNNTRALPTYLVMVR